VWETKRIDRFGRTSLRAKASAISISAIVPLTVVVGTVANRIPAWRMNTA
jgi:hypothetical protein